MADFSYIREHPWWTAAIVLGGGLVVYLIYERMKNSSAQPSATTVDTTGSVAQVDPTVAAQLSAQQAQLNAQLQGLTIQGQTQVDLASIQAGVQSQTVAATQDVTNRQTAAAQDVQNQTTAAQLTLGVATLDAQTQQEQINAAVQIANINALLEAFGLSKSNTTTTTPVSNSTGNPVQTQLPPVTQYVQVPSYNVPGVSNPNPVPVTTPVNLNPNATGGANTTGGGIPLYQADVTGNIAGGGTYGVNSQYYLTPQATAQLASILGTTSSVVPSVVGASGGPFSSPPTEDIQTPSGAANAGQLMAELQNTAPGEWSTILGGYGLPSDPATINNIYNMLGPNQAVPAHA